MRLTIERFDEFDRKITIRLRVHNLSSKNVRAIEAGLEVDDLSGARIATTEVHRTADIPPHGSLAIDISMPYTQFGEDTGSMREALGKPQRQRIDVKEIKYSDGSDAGYDD